MNRVVITGMGIISPIGNSVSDFSYSLRNGKVGIDFITRFDTADFKVKLAAEVKNFNASEYYDDKSEIRRTDMFVQYAMGAAVQAMQDSGLKDIEPTRFGVYVGSGVGGMQTFTAETKKLLDRGPSRVSPFFITMMISNMASGTIAMRFNAQGPSLPVVSACATSGNAIGEAYRAIKHGYADAIIAGGAEGTICPLAVAGFTSCLALSESDDPSRASIPFDKDRNGFVMGEGAGIVILEEYEHAKARNAKIYAEVCGYGNTCDAYHITAPHPEALGAANAISLAVNEAGISGKDKIYINAHGTSTPMNDKTETLAIKKVFGEDAYRIPISSTKSMTGHMLGAAGAAEAITGVLALKEGFIPPTMNYMFQDEECDLDYVPNEARKADLDFVLSNSFGFGGHNACLALRKI
ncbi:MAG: beta-ketoacyl-[acyl-carrier-protein] synthase II [Clostridiales bacterium GWF2_36_10]|nr:MAG: beta-ketoacyl-[acyl-carrier-protein] synthase II [Clostridiales bacterium GWF2_36_10]HAN21076.1 beta-ketoacyl-[acyl-carrier-protein] synthase II [Clostridiales bacterium]